MSSSLPDIVIDTRLDTRISPEYTSIFHQDVETDTTIRPRRTEERWKRSRKAGKGGFGTVWLHKCMVGAKCGQSRAVKEIDRGDGDLSSSKLVRELEAIAKFSQKRYRYCFVESFGWYESSKKLYIAMEYLEKGDLSKYLHQPIPEPEAAAITAQIVEGLAYMHGSGFIHRDLKPQNLLVKSTGPGWWIKIGDFGISKKILESSGLTTVVGSEAYMAPELRGLFPPGLGNLTKGPATAIDLWAVGMMAWRMIANKTPLSTQELPSYVHYGTELGLDATIASRECRDFVGKLLARSAGDRPTCQEAHGHPWLQSHRDPVPASQDIAHEEEEFDAISNGDTDQTTLEYASWTTKNSPTLLANPGFQSLPVANEANFLGSAHYPEPQGNTNNNNNYPVLRNDTTLYREHGSLANGILHPPEETNARRPGRDRRVIFIKDPYQDEPNYHDYRDSSHDRSGMVPRTIGSQAHGPAQNELDRQTDTRVYEKIWVSKKSVVL